MATIPDNPYHSPLITYGDYQRWKYRTPHEIILCKLLENYDINDEAWKNLCVDYVVNMLDNKYDNLADDWQDKTLVLSVSDLYQRYSDYAYKASHGNCGYGDGRRAWTDYMMDAFNELKVASAEYMQTIVLPHYAGWE